MARPREFDRVEVVAHAAELFRLRGYAATSMRDLITHLGLSSSSIYGAFGGKYGLFMAALEHGAAQDRAMITAALDHPAGVMAGLSALYDGLIDSLLAEDASAASLTLRAALEYLESDAKDPAKLDVTSGARSGARSGPGSGATSGAPVPASTQAATDEPDVLDALRAHFADLSALVAARLVQAEERGELRLNQAASDLALFVLLNAFNLTIVVKLTHDRNQLAAYVRAALDAVAGPSTRSGSGPRTDA